MTNKADRAAKISQRLEDGENLFALIVSLALMALVAAAALGHLGWLPRSVPYIPAERLAYLCGAWWLVRRSL